MHTDHHQLEAIMNKSLLAALMSALKYERSAIRLLCGYLLCQCDVMRCDGIHDKDAVLSMRMQKQDLGSQLCFIRLFIFVFRAYI